MPSSTVPGGTIVDDLPFPSFHRHRRVTTAPASLFVALQPRVPAQLKPGTVVRVRTRTAKLKTGQVLVLCLKATIVSSSTDGGYEVVYDANLPRGDPKSTVHVAPHQVRVIDPSPSPTTLPPSLPPPTATVAATTKKEMPRPTTAGKSLRLIRSLFPEMELPVRAWPVLNRILAGSCCVILRWI